MELLTKLWYVLTFQATENETSWDPTLFSLTVWVLIIIVLLILYASASNDWGDSDFFGDIDFD